MLVLFPTTARSFYADQNETLVEFQVYITTATVHTFLSYLKFQATMWQRDSMKPLSKFFVTITEESYTTYGTWLLKKQCMHANWNNGDFLRTTWPKTTLFSFLIMHLATMKQFKITWQIWSWIFVPKCTMSRLEPFYAGIMRGFKCKYRKLLIEYVVSRIDEGKKISKQ